MPIPIDLLMLVMLSLTTAIGVPLYIFFREKMIRKKKSNSIYTKRRVIKIMLVNMLITFFIAAQLIILLMGILLRDTIYTMQTLSLVVVFVFVMFIVFYGAGMYLTTIIIEDFTPSTLLKNKALSTIFIPIKIFHGPVSHVFVYGGTVLVLLMLSLLDITRPSRHLFDMPLLLGLGGVTGMFYVVSAVYSKIYVYQLYVVLFSVVILFGMLSIKGMHLFSFPVFSFFFVFCTVFITGVSLYLCTKK